MEDQENTRIESTENSLDVIVEEYEQRIKDLNEAHKKEVDSLREEHVRELRTLMRTGTSPEAERIHVEEEEKPVDEQILDSLRKKYKLN